ncbi:MAG: DUF721 domain-containing protein [Acidobacteria bacterium]|nr:DUF721 domain-containing protein [Acidobacteriota bacterium]
MEPVSSILPQAYRKLAGQAADEEALLLSLWPVVVGSRVAARTRPIRLFGFTLIVETAAQDWRKQLAQMSGDIVTRLNAAAGKAVLKDLEFRVAVKQAPIPPRRAASASGHQQDEAEQIPDAHLRRLYRLSRKRQQGK